MPSVLTRLSRARRYRPVAVLTYRRLLPVLRGHRGRLAALVAVSCLGPVLLAARVWLLKTLIDDVLRGHHPGLLAVVAVGFVGIAFARSGLSWWSQTSSARVGTEVVRALRVRVFGHLQGLSLRWFHDQSLGDLLTRLTGDTAAIEDLLVSGVSAVLTHVVTLGLFLGLLVYLDPGLLALAAGIVPGLVVLTVVEARLGRRAQREVREASSGLLSVAEQGLSAIALVKAFARGGYETARIDRAAQRSSAARLRAVRLRAVVPSVGDLLAAVGTAVVVWVGARQVLAGQLSLGSLVVFISYLASLYVPIQGLGRLTGTFARALVGAERVLEVLDTPAGLTERAGAPLMPVVRGRVEIDRVGFGYHPDRPVLREVSLRIGPGELVAVIGASGAGKTTLASLLLSYYEPDHGQIRLDGHPLHRYDPPSVRTQVAAVLQEPMLFDTTITENIHYGHLGATDAEVRTAARAAGVAEFAEQLPDGYHTVIGPRGARLSGGQRQRVAIARALVKPAPLLLLDEATSALDPHTEARVLAGIRAARPQAAVLLIAHRATTIAHADRVVVLEQGRVVQDGAAHELTVAAGTDRAFLDTEQPATTRPIPA